MRSNQHQYRNNDPSLIEQPRPQGFNLGVLSLPLAALSFAVVGPTTAIALRTIDVFTIVAGRTFIAAFVIILLLRTKIQMVWQESSRQAKLLLVSLGALLGVHLGLYVAGVNNTSYVSAMTLVSLEPIVVLFAGVIFFRITPTLRQGLGTALAICGTLVIGLSSLEKTATVMSGPAHSLLGDLCIVFAAISYGFYYVANRKLSAEVAASRLPLTDNQLSLAFAAIIYVTAGIVAMGLQWYNGAMGLGHLMTPSRESLIALVIIGLVPTLIGHTCNQIAARSLPPAWMALLAPTETLGSIVIGMLILHASPTPYEAIGGIAVISGAITVVLGGRKGELSS